MYIGSRSWNLDTCIFSMDCNKDEAMRAKEIAEKKMQSSDFEAARKIVLKARNLYPELENITQMLSICDVYCSAQIRLPGVDKDWYGVLQVEKLADESTIKKQYRRLALILHPDKNRFPGAEGAFKLICEANALLSDPAKKSLYDNKVRLMGRPAQTNPPKDDTSKSFQFNRQYGAQNNSFNGLKNQNQSQPPQFLPVFWTCCPYCKTNYQYPGQFVNKYLQCSKCIKGFMAYKTSGPSGPSGPSAKVSHQGAPSKPNTPQPEVSRAKVETSQANSETGTKNVKVPPTSHAVKPQPSVQKGGGSESIKADSAAQNLKTKETVNLNASNLHGKKVGIASNVNAVRESKNARNKSQNRGRKVVLESSDDSDADIENVTEQVNLGDAAATDLKSESASDQLSRKSRRRQQVSYNEANEDNYARPLKRARTTKEADGKEHENYAHGEGSVHANQKSFPSAKKEIGATKSNEKHKKEGCDKEGEVRGVNGGRSNAPPDMVEIESDSDLDSSSDKSSDGPKLDCPDPDFSNFDDLRDGSQFRVNQLWALYDSHDSMPRYYAMVRKVVSSSPLELQVTWLEAVPINDSWEKWVDEEFPVGCGSFKIGKPEKVFGNVSISHPVHFQKGKKRGSVYVYPRKGEVWALYRDWDISWSSNVEDHEEFKYEIVEVLSDFAADVGIRVLYLNKVSGFVSLFQRAVQNETNCFLIQPKELYRFSHCVPSFKMSGAEREGVPIGSFELDPASLPANPEDLYYPSKANFECRDKDAGVGSSSVLKFVDKKGKSVLSEGPCSPRKVVDLEGTRGDSSRLRRSPRVVNK